MADVKERLRSIATGLTNATIGDQRAALLEAIAIIERLEQERDRLMAIVDHADSLVTMWESPTIQALSRAERNDAIADIRKRLIHAVSLWRDQEPSAAARALEG